MRAARLAFLFLALSWIVLVLAAPVAALGTAASGLVYAFGSLICHQRSDRSFHLGAAQLPVCARCFGIYAGAAATGLVAALKPCATLRPGSTPARWRSPSGLRTMVLVGAMPTAVTWGSEVLGLWSPANLTRFIAALPLGAVVALTVNYVECVRPQRMGPSPPRMPI